MSKKRKRGLGSLGAAVEDATDYVVKDASYGPGDQVKRVATTKGAKVISDGMRKVLAEIEDPRSDNSQGRWSRMLAYVKHVGRNDRSISKTDHANLIRLIKGGHVSVCKVSGLPPPGSRAARETPHTHDYYIFRVGSCPSELPDGALRGLGGARRRKRRSR